MSKIYVKSDWDKVRAYIVTVDDWPGEIMSKNSDGFYERDVTGIENMNGLITDGNSSHSEVLPISTLVGKVYDTATATISDYPSTTHTQKFVTLNNLKRFLKNADDRYCTESEINTKLSGKSDTNHTHSNYLTGITKAMVTTALGYTPPAQDTNTTYSAGSNLSLNDTTFNVSSTPSFTDITISGYTITID